MIADDVLISEGVAVHDLFLSLSQVEALMRSAEERRQQGEFREAKIGLDASLHRDIAIRGDSTCWITEPKFAAEVALLETFERLRLRLNSAAYLGLWNLELHYASYAPGTSYARHVDQPRGQRRNQRQVSLVLYLNERWEPGHGGELRLFESGAYRDVEPIAGRLVCFLTEDREHAVLPTLVPRLSISGWFRSRD